MRALLAALGLITVLATPQSATHFDTTIPDRGIYRMHAPLLNSEVYP